MELTPATTPADEQRKALALAFLQAFEDGGTTSSGGSVLDLFADDAQVCFPKWGAAHGRAEIADVLVDVGPTIHSISHDLADINWVGTGGDVLVAEGTSHGVHRDGSWGSGSPERGGGRWCDVFQIHDGHIHRLFVHLDPEHAGKDTARYPWLE
jgi:hypothetical protein